MIEYHRRRRTTTTIPTAAATSPSFLLLVCFIAIIIFVSFGCYLIVDLLIPDAHGPQWNGRDSRNLMDDQRKMLTAMEHARRYRKKYLQALGLPKNTTVSMLPQVLGKANLTLQEALLLEPIILQLVQWGQYDDLIKNIPTWIVNGIEQVKGPLTLDGRFLRDRYVKIESESQKATQELQNVVVGLQKVINKSKQRINDNFEQVGEKIKVVESKESHGNGTWIDHMKQDIGDLVKKIESAGGDVFHNLHKAGLAHLETVIRVPGEDEGHVHPNDETIHKNVTGHSPGIIIDPFNNRFVLARPSNLAIVGEDSKLLMEIMALLVLSLSIGYIFDLLKIPTFLGYLLAGVILGPSCLDYLQNMMQINTIGQLALLLIIMSLGLEFSLDKIRSTWKMSLFGSLLMTIVGGILSFFIGVYLFNISVQQALFSGLIISFSSTLVAIKCLQSSGEKTVMNSLIGKTVMGVLVAQDLFFCMALALLPVLALGHSTLIGLFGTLLVSLAKKAAYLCVCLWVSRFICNKMPWIFQEPLQLIGFIAIAAISGHTIGINMELGVFLAAMSISTFSTDSFENCFSLLGDISSAMFFGSVGILLDLRFLWGELFLLIPLSLAIVLIKALTTTIIFRILGMDIRGSITIGVDLAQISELALMLGARGRKLGIITAECHYILAGITALGMLFSPLLMSFVHNVDYRLKRRQLESSV